jgi:hypothetical protein
VASGGGVNLVQLRCGSSTDQPAAGALLFTF